jgi:hypothetical protein
VCGIEGGGAGDGDGGTAGGIEAEGRDGAESREAVEAPREAASMVRRRERQQCRGWETWAT